MVTAMRSLAVVASVVVPVVVSAVPWIVACGPSTAPAPAAPGPSPSPPAPAQAAHPATPWRVPDGFHSETIPFPLDFAPGVAHRGAEELRFAPGFFDAAAPGYWSYAFAWRTEDPAELDAAGLGAELTTYFRGLIDAVDKDKQIADRDAISVRATAAGARFTLAAHLYDAFRTRRPIDLAGWAERTACGTGALWRFVLAPTASAVRPTLDALAADAACGQPVPPPAP
jgi:hypothetical protein